VRGSKFCGLRHNITINLNPKWTFSLDVNLLLVDESDNTLVTFGRFSSEGATN
jgi:hypothetical protein